MKVKYRELSKAKGQGGLDSIKASVHDITDYCTAVTWGGSKSEVARKLQISLANPVNDPNARRLTMKLGSMLFLYSDSGEELFRGYIIERERDTNDTVSYTAYDACFYLLKSSATYKFKKKTPEAIAETVCKDIQVKTGSLAKTGKPYALLMKDKTIYQIIMAGYTKAKKATGDKFHLYADKGKICVRKIGDEWFDLLISDDSNILSATNRESLAEVVNRVKVYDGKNHVIKVVKNDDSMTKYGVFQHTYTKEKDKDPTNSAKAMLRGVGRTMDLEVLGDVRCVTGKCVRVKEAASGLVGKFYVESDTHSWNNGVHTMKIGLSLYNKMDTQSEDKETKSGKKAK